jgi:competence protein ComEC
MLIDGGDALGADMGRLIVGRFLAHKGINTIDVVMATHPHTDHIGGLVAILQNFKVRYFIDNGDYAANPFCKKCAAILEKKRIRRFRVREGDRIEGFKNAAIAVLNPPRPGFRDQNDNSIVIKLAHGRCSVLFCGDIEEEAAAGLLLRHKEALCSTALKVPHHGGSLGEAGQAFLSAIRPHIVVISLGSRPPDERLLEELNGLGARVYRTDRDGAIILKNRNGEENSYCQFPFL